jgi:hypothetical protein
MGSLHIAGSKSNNLKMLPNFNTYNPRLNGRELCLSERKTFFDLLNELATSDVLIIYRGDNKRKILKRYNNSSMPHPFNDYLFMLGTKGKYFFEEIQKKVAGSKDVFPISDISQKFFERIFEMLSNLFNVDPQSFNAKLRRRFEKFIASETQVSIFFKERTNKKTFLQKVNEAEEKDKLLIRDYYLNLLHHFGNSEFYPTSFLLSTTTSFDVARDFVKSEIPKENEIIFFGWIPRGDRNMMLHTSHYNFIRRKVLERNNLPMYKMSFFPRQKEISLKGGFLPHYMIGYFYTESGEKLFEINPTLFDELKPNWIQKGFPIDQSLFFLKAGEVALGKGVYVDHEGNFGDINLNMNR